MANDRMEEAHDLLKRACRLGHFHFDEFSMYCKAQIFYSILKNEKHDAAKRWFEMWERSVPDDTKLDSMRSFVRTSMLVRVRVKQVMQFGCTPRHSKKKIANVRKSSHPVLSRKPPEGSLWKILSLTFGRLLH